MRFKVHPAVETTLYISGMVICLSVILAGCGISKPAPRLFLEESLYAPMKFQGKLGNELAYPKMDMDGCIRQGKEDGMSDRDIVEWCLKVAK